MVCDVLPSSVTSSYLRFLAGWPRQLTSFIISSSPNNVRRPSTTFPMSCVSYPWLISVTIRSASWSLIGAQCILSSSASHLARRARSSTPFRICCIKSRTSRFCATHAWSRSGTSVLRISCNVSNIHGSRGWNQSPSMRASVHVKQYSNILLKIFRYI